MARGAIQISGEVADVEFKHGNEGTERQYAFHIVTIFAGKTAAEVKWDPKRTEGECPKEGDFVTLDVELGVFSNRLQITARRRSPALHAAAKSA